MSKFTRNQVLVFKIESVEGTDAVPTGAANAILAVDVNIEPLNARSVPRNLARGFMGAQPEQQTGKFVAVSFRVEMAGAGAATTVPKWGPLVRACGLAQTSYAATAADTIATAYKRAAGATGAFTYTKTAAYTGKAPRTVKLECTTGGGSGTAEFTVTAPAIDGLVAYNQTGVVMTDATPFALGGSATITPTVGTNFVIGDVFEIRLAPARTEYVPVSSGQESATFWFEMDGILHKATGARGELGWTVENGIPYWTCRFNGLYAVPTDDTISGADFSGFKAPVLAQKGSVPVVRLHGVDAARLAMFSGQFGNQVDPRFLANDEHVPITDRNMTGSIRFDAQALSVKNWFTAAANSTTGRLEFHHGTAAGAIVTLEAPAVQVRPPRYGSDRGIATLEMGLVFQPTDAGDDELIVCTC